MRTTKNYLSSLPSLPPPPPPLPPELIRLLPEKTAFVDATHVRKGTPVVHDLDRLHKILKPGDIIATKMNEEAKRGSKVVDYLATKAVEVFGGSPWSHTAIYKGRGEIIHTTPKTETEPIVHHDTLSRVLGTGRDLLIMRPTKIPPIRRADAVKRMESLEGTGYSYGDVAATLAPWAVSADGQYAKKPDGATCTHTNAWAYPDLKFDRPIRALRPKDYVENKDLKQIAAFSLEKKSAFGLLGPAAVGSVGGVFAGGAASRYAGGEFNKAAPVGSLFGFGGSVLGMMAGAAAQRYGASSGLVNALQIGGVGAGLLAAGLAGHHTGKTQAEAEMEEQKRKERDAHLQSLALGVANADRWRKKGLFR